MKRVLVISYYWPPSGGSGVQRWVKFAKYLPAEGWQPVVYVPENPSYDLLDPSLAEEIPPEAEVLRHRICEPYAAYRRLMGRGASTDMKTLTEVTPISSGRKSWKQRLSLWVRGNFFVPDPRRGWVRPSVRFLKKHLREHPVDIIVTTGPPHSMHLIGQRLHAALGTPWIPDFRDPWTKMYYLKHLPMSRRTWRRLERMEQAVLDECSTVLAVTPAVQADFAARTRTPVAMITNGYDETDFADPHVGLRPPQDDSVVIPSEARNLFTLSHTGLFAADGNPLALWKVLGGMAEEDSLFRAKLSLRLSGKVDRAVLDAIAAAGLSDRVVNLGYVDHATAVQEQRAATVLLLPLRNDPEYKPILPGKLFEYLAARRPVLGIGQEDGAMAAVLRETEAGVMCDWENETAIRAFLTRSWETFREQGSVPPTTGPVEKYSRRNLTHELAALLDRCAAAARPVSSAFAAEMPQEADFMQTRAPKRPKS